VICRHFGVCGGCSLPAQPYPEQIRQKQERLRSWFPRTEVLPFLPSPSIEGFRHKVAFVFGVAPDGRRLVMGHYAAGTRRVVPIEECPVHSDLGNRLAFELRDHLARARVPPGLLRHVLIRTTAAGTEAAVMLVVGENHHSLRAPIRAFLQRPSPPTGFFVNVHDRPGPYMVGRQTIRIHGRSHVREEVSGASFLISPTTFFQTNVGAAAALARVVLDRAGQPDRVLDLYCGSGLFTVCFARRGTRVIAVEENRQAVRDAEVNLRLNRVPAEMVRLTAARVEDAGTGLPSGSAVIVLDPPRQGCPDRVIEAVFGRLAADRVVYVSCNPERLASERPRIDARGYGLTSVQGIDMFPHTDHIEAVAVFERRSQRREAV
jgi:23S rRNA (uracil1939-C5)-methyltransferase